MFVSGFRSTLLHLFLESPNASVWTCNLRKLLLQKIVLFLHSLLKSLGFASLVNDCAFKLLLVSPVCGLLLGLLKSDNDGANSRCLCVPEFGSKVISICTESTFVLVDAVLTGCLHVLDLGWQLLLLFFFLIKANCDFFGVLQIVLLWFPVPWFVVVCPRI